MMLPSSAQLRSRVSPIIANKVLMPNSSIRMSLDFGDFNRALSLGRIIE